MFAVMGITGQVGAGVANSLLSQGKQVRAIVRNPEKAASWKDRGAEIAVAEYDNVEALTQVLHGVEGVFVMIPPYFAPSPDLREPKAIISAVCMALAQARPPKAVYLSSIGAEQTSGLGLITALHILEQEMAALPIPSAFLRAGWFMENGVWDLESARDQGEFFSYLAPLDKTYPLVATSDVGSTAAAVLQQEWKGQRFLEIAGPQRYSALDIAQEWSSIFGTKVEAVAVPREEWVESFVKQGTAKDRTALRVEMLDAFNSGWIHFGVTGTEKITGQTTLKAVFEGLVERARGKEHAVLS